jgi:CheY-like chemotaxis protein
MAGVSTELARVLIVDDKADIRALLATRLRLEPSFDVVGEAANGAEAIARVGELSPHLMILDLQMPVMSGEEVIPILRSLAPLLRILVFSAYARPQRSLCGSERPDAEVRKGTGLKPLVDELHRLIDSEPEDLVDVALGDLEVERAVRAGHAWARMNPSVRARAVERGMHADFLALVGVFLALGEPLRQAARSQRATCSLGFATRLEAGRGARRALCAIGDVDGAVLEPLRSLLLTELPA